MARTKKRSRAKAEEPKSRNLPFHAFWSGSLSFGLVNVPVLLFPASRHSGVRLRMMSPGGSLLERRFFCPRDGKEVAPDEIVRGYALDDESYIIVDDQELEAIEPQKTREIDLRQFVDIADLPPLLLERGYYLTPAKESTKAYRLLADVMERTRRAGIATFVMRDREYLVAIFARGGVLCAETLRFQDEIRDPGTIGLPEPAPAEARRVSKFTRAIDNLFAGTVGRDQLADVTTKTLKAIIEKKRKARRDLVRIEPEGPQADSEQDEDVDLLETIRRSLRDPATKSHTRPRPAARSPKRESTKRQHNVAAQARKRRPKRIAPA
jgi:DNA end-binding protein Ku